MSGVGRAGLDQRSPHHPHTFLLLQQSQSPSSVYSTSKALLTDGLHFSVLQVESGPQQTAGVDGELPCASPSLKGHSPALSIIQDLKTFALCILSSFIVSYSGRVSLITHYSIMTRTTGLSYLIFVRSVLDIFQYFSMLKLFYREKFKINNKLTKLLV